MREKKKQAIEHEEGSGNVYADLGLEDADELYARAQLGFHVHKLLVARNLKQRDIADLLGVKQPEVSHLMNGHFSRFTPTSCWSFSSGSTRPSPPASARTGRGNRIKRLALERKQQQNKGLRFFYIKPILNLNPSGISGMLLHFPALPKLKAL